MSEVLAGIVVLLLFLILVIVVLLILVSPMVASLFSIVRDSAQLVQRFRKQRQDKLQSMRSATAPSGPAVRKRDGPPRSAEYTLHLFLNARDRRNVIGDLEEEYRDIELKFDRRAANIWYCKQVVTSIGPQLKRVIIKWVSIAWVEEWVRRHL